MPKLESVIGPYGRKLEFFYVGDRLERIRDPAGEEILYGCDAAGQLTSVTYPDLDDPAGKTRIYHYDDPNPSLSHTPIIPRRFSGV